METHGRSADNVGHDRRLSRRVEFQRPGCAATADPNRAVDRQRAADERTDRDLHPQQRQPTGDQVLSFAALLALGCNRRAGTPDSGHSLVSNE